MPTIRGITISVGEWYSSTLDICLIRNMRHMTECLVVTAPGDPAVEVARRVPGVKILETDAFTRHGARFNKGLAMEEGFSALGKTGWLLVHDADVIFPDQIPLDMLRPDALHGMPRRLLDDPGAWTPALEWRKLPLRSDGAPIGYFQLFHAAAPTLRNREVWYDVSFAHAGGGDAYFLELFAPERRVMLPREVLHLGPVDAHWFGTDAEAKAEMAAFARDKEWERVVAQHATQPAAPYSPVHRVEVPGYTPTGYELPLARPKRKPR